MGSSASKGARAAGSAVRKYPTRVPTSTNRAPAAPEAPPPTPSPDTSAQSRPPASATKPQAIDVDARDPGLAARLNALGAVQPNPHFSPSSTSNLDPQRNRSADVPADMMQPPPESAFASLRDNPALRVLEARQNIQDEADHELEQIGRRGFEGRKYLDAGTIQLALMRRKRGESDARVEQAFGIKKGRLAVLGKGYVESVNSAE